MDPYEPSKNVTFESEQYKSSPLPQQSPASRSKIVRLVITSSGGLVQNEQQAIRVLIGFVVAAFIITIFLIFGGGGGEAELKAPPGRTIVYPDNAPPRLEPRF